MLEVWYQMWIQGGAGGVLGVKSPGEMAVEKRKRKRKRNYGHYMYGHGTQRMGFVGCLDASESSLICNQIT